jgi:fructuronate reductase
MVNGAHSSIAYLAVAAGWATVDLAIAQPALRAHVQALMRDEIEPTLGALPGLDLPSYRAQLIERFANPALAHRTLQIAMDGSQKMPQRLLGTVRDRLAQGASIDRLAFGIAAWLTHLRGHDDAGQRVPLDDPQAAALRALHAQAMAQADARQRAAVFTAYRPVFGDLAGRQRLVDALAPALQALHEQGAERALAQGVT